MVSFKPGVELCDDGNLNQKDACLNDCTPARCGDGILHIGVEECDDGNFDNGDLCRNDCTRARCGDGVLQPHDEECDHGELNGRDGRCSEACVRTFDCSVGGLRVLGDDAEINVPRSHVCESDRVLF